LSEQPPDIHIEVAFSSTVPTQVRESVLSELRAKGFEPTVRHLAYASTELDPKVLAFTVLITYLLKPSAEALGIQIRDALTLAANTLKGQLGLDGTYLVTVETKDRQVRYWVPANEHEDEAWRRMGDDFSRRPETDRDRRWWPGKGWLTDPEIWREAKTTKGTRTAP
jgi:hypothetical protein